MEASWMQANYRAIFTEMLLAQSAAMGAFADVGARCALLAGQQYQQALITFAREMAPKGGAVASAQPGGGSGIPAAFSARSGNFGRAFAGLPRVSMMVFLSQYDNLRGRRGVVRDWPASKRQPKQPIAT
jgi:hypothetical protein